MSNLKEATGMGNNNESVSKRSRNYCWLYVGIGDKEFVAGKAQLERLVGCSVCASEGEVCSVL